MAEYLSIIEESMKSDLAKLEPPVSSHLMVHNIAIEQSFTKSNLSQGIQRHDFSLLPTRCAYVLGQSAYNAHLVYRCMKSLMADHPGTFIKWLLPLKQQKAMGICCLGGGPGLEVLGLLRSLRENTDYCDDIKLHINNMDSKIEWESMYRNILANGRMNCHYFANFFVVDLLRLVPRHILLKINNCDVITLVKVLSTILWNKKMCMENLKLILSHMKPGSIIIFADVIEVGAFDLFEEVANECGLQKLYCNQKASFQLKFKGTKKEMLQNYQREYGINPLISERSDVAVWTMPPAKDKRQVDQIVSLIKGMHLKI